ncbi:hypothetical protein C923_02766 [Plasmodium falciparum UGT5.1]|uniref:Uncharacterized protein n=3 Tax=Plasmodium falciparum TaxID=5833 RepID=W7JTS3_PLAFO|nr:hypothetical protein PFNF135_02847 [Plasmodium falciparum NF135/5.C10]EWC76539.1 hypothetical protein C923_02766 [Plasmodium falciparum UGT5.1]EWC88373.1 hypothetical protein PFNF54_02692 [Plasmodium falciparum NF54]
MIKMKFHYVGYYSEEENMKNTLKICSVRQIFLNLLSIVGIVLVVILNSISICEKSETMNDGIYFIHRRNLSELKDVEYSGLRSNNEIFKLKNTVDEKK